MSCRVRLVRGRELRPTVVVIEHLHLSAVRFSLWIAHLDRTNSVFGICDHKNTQQTTPMRVPGRFEALQRWTRHNPNHNSLPLSKPCAPYKYLVWRTTPSLSLYAKSINWFMRIVFLRNQRSKFSKIMQNSQKKQTGGNDRVLLRLYYKTVVGFPFRSARTYYADSMLPNLA